MSTITPGSSDYPERLNKLYDPPKRLFISGRLPDFSQPVIAAIGSRKPSAYGKLVTDKLVGELAGAGIHIISGLALGIDSLAHQATLRSGGKTSAVLPSALDEVYPASHRSLAEKIISSGGALISEYPEGTRAAAYHFPARNRIVAALADAVLVIEAGEKSGTLITAEHALDIGVPVLLVPGPINSPLSIGTNRLIQLGAAIVTGVHDIFNELGLEPVPTPPALVEDELSQSLLDHISRTAQATSMELAAACGLGLSEVNRRLTHLELLGAVKVQGGVWVLA